MIDRLACSHIPGSPRSRKRFSRWGVGLAWGLLLLGASGYSSISWAVRTRSFMADSYTAFLRAKVEGVALSDDGRLFSAPAVTRLADPGARTVWALALGKDSRIIMGTGDQGKVYAVPTEGKSAEPQSLADLTDYELFALTSDAKGSLYLSGAPTGTVTQIQPDGKVRSLFRVPEQVVFALLAAPDGSVFAAAGERGRLYRITQDGEGKVFAESSDLSLRCLAWGLEGQIWAGTSGRGLVESISPETGKVRVVYDAAEEEIVSILPLPKGGLIFAANPGAPGGGGSQSSPNPDGGAPSPPAAGSDREGASTAEPVWPVLYRMTPSGSVRSYWKCPEKTIHGLALEEDGSVLVATGNDGAIYRVSPEGRETVLWEPEEPQVLSILLQGKTILAGTGSPGRLYRLGPGLAPEGKFTSEVLDGKDQVKWGHLRFEGSSEKGELAFETHSGYTKEVDSSWSDWTPLEDEPAGLRVASPPARFLQWRALFKPASGQGPLLRRVAVSYGGANSPPRISSLRVSSDEPNFTSGEPGHGGITQILPGGVQIDYSLSAANNPIVAVDEVPTWIRRVRSFVWDASDADGDDLEFTLEIRALGEENFRVLAQEVRDRGFSVDSGMLPDGAYEVRLTASDAPANAPGTELTATRLTPPFHVDTVAPTISEVKAARSEGGAVLISGLARDESSPLRRIDAAIDGGPFLWLSPKDGLMDSRIEAFEGRVPLQKDQTGNWIVVRAQDEAGNRGSYRVWLQP